MASNKLKTTSEMQLVDINLLVPYINNARTHSPEQINKLRFHEGIRIRQPHYH